MARTAGSHSDITGPKIVRSAEALFARHGYAAVSMRQIAKEVGVQVGALYNYTPDKQTLLFDMMQSHMDDLLSAAMVDAVADPVAQLRSYVTFHIAFHHARPDAVFVAYMELRNLTPDNFAKVEGLRRDYEQRLEDILIAGKKAGAFDVADTKIATLAVIAMLTGVNTWFRSDGRLSLDEVQAIYCKMVSRAVGATV